MGSKHGAYSWYNTQTQEVDRWSRADPRTQGVPIPSEKARNVIGTDDDTDVGRKQPCTDVY